MFLRPDTIMIRNIVFDIGMVLIDFRWKQVMEDLGFPKEVITFLDENFINATTWQELDRGVMNTQEVLKIVQGRKKEYANYVMKFWEHIEEAIVAYDYAAPWLRELKERGFHIYLLTNYPDELFAANELDRFPFIPYVDGAIVSSRVHFIKPEAQIYQSLLDTYQLKAEECVFMDDRGVNVEGAKEMGLHAFVFNGHEDAKEKLEEIIRLQKG